MSSIVESTSNQKLTEKKVKFFLRSSSFEKLCLARYPLKMSDIKLNKNAIIEVLERTIIKGRILSLKALIILILATFKFVGIIFTLCGASGNPLVCDKEKKTRISSITQGYYERLQSKLANLQKHKIRLESSLKKNEPTVTSINNNLARIPQPIKIEECLSKKNKFSAEIAKIRSLYTPELTNKSTDNQKLYLSAAVYGSLLFLYIQAIFLLYKLNGSYMPAGFIFLMTSLVLIAVIVYQVFFWHNHYKRNRKEINSRKEQSNSETDKNINELTAQNLRQSRTRLKTIIDLQTKTLSKIKLL